MSSSRLLKIVTVVTVLTDLALMFAAFAIAYVIRYQLQWFRDVDPAYFTTFLPYVPMAVLQTTLTLIAFALEGVFRVRRGASLADEIYGVINGVTTGFVIEIFILFFWRPLVYSRLIFVYATVLIMVFIILARVVRRSVLSYLRSRRHHRDPHRRSTTPPGRANDSSAGNRTVQRDSTGKFLLFQLFALLPRALTRFSSKEMAGKSIVHRHATLGPVLDVQVKGTRGPLHSRLVHVDDGRRQVMIGVGETWPGGQHWATTGDHRVAVVDRTPRFVAQQVDDVTDVKARAFQHEPLPDRMLSKRKVARAWIQNEIHAARRQVPGPVRDPRVFADLETYPHVATFEDDVAQGVTSAVQVELHLSVRRPRFEPAWLVVNALARQILFGDETCDPLVRDQAGRVKEAPTIEREAAQ